MNTVINLSEKLSDINEYWAPKIISSLNDYHIKLAKIKGEFTWHRHNETDEMFLVIKGKMKIDFRDRQIVLLEGELFVVPKGEEHKPVCENECEIMLIEPKGTVNTGDSGGHQTASNKDWI